MTPFTDRRAAPRRAAPYRSPSPRRVLVCVWAPCPATGVLACRWTFAAPDLVLVDASQDRGEPPPAHYLRAA